VTIENAENVVAVREALKLACFRVGSQKKFAEMHGFSESFVSDVIRGRRDITPRLAELIGFACVIVYRAKEREEK
jgi:DNA-binding transcriptional regulator YdaS (Cro superfamily)